MCASVPKNGYSLFSNMEKHNLCLNVYHLFKKYDVGGYYELLATLLTFKSPICTQMVITLKRINIFN